MKTIFEKLKHTKNRDNTDDNDKPSTNSPDNPSTKDNEWSSSSDENYSDEKSRHKHGKPVNVSHTVHLDSETDSDRTYVGTTNASTNHHVYNDDLNFFTLQLFYHYKRFNFVQMLSSSCWASFQNLKISLLKWKKSDGWNSIITKIEKKMSSVQNLYKIKSR